MASNQYNVYLRKRNTPFQLSSLLLLMKQKSQITLFTIYIYIYKRLFVPMYLPMSLFHKRTAGPISTKFCTDLPTNPGMVLSTIITAPTRPPDPRVPQTPKDVSSSNFSWAVPGPGWLVIYIGYLVKLWELGDWGSIFMIWLYMSKSWLIVVQKLDKNDLLTHLFTFIKKSVKWTIVKSTLFSFTWFSVRIISS